MHLEIDPDRCTGHGRCYMLEADLFEPDEEGRGVVLGAGDVDPDQEASAMRAVRGCPEGAIKLV